MQLNNISKTYKTGGTRKRVLDRICIQVRSQEVTTIVGSSGSGKTTMLRVMGGLSQPDAGTVSVPPLTDLYAQSDGRLSHYRNRSVGFIFQDYRLLSNYNAQENVMVPLKVAGFSPRERRTRVAWALDIVGLRSYRNRRVDQLSGGQAQRVSIARAIAMRPRMIIADEPTGNLDSARGAEIMRLFHRLRNQQGISIVMVTHDDDLANQADHLISIADGRVREDSDAAA
jgi:putative ABC transport system ATP-binding protein